MSERADAPSTSDAMPRQEGVLAERPDLDRYRASVALCCGRKAPEPYPFCESFGCSSITELVDHAARLEREAEALRAGLRAIEWDENTDNFQCAWCMSAKASGHEDGCKFAALLTAEREAEAVRASAEPRCHPHRYATSATSRWYRDRDGREVEVRPNGDGTVDEIVTDEIHLEQMDRNAYYMRINGVMFWFHARGKITLTHEPDTAREVVVPLEETCEGNGCGIFGAAEREGRES